jgi:NADH-quinone oxidoreductase subunit K
MHIVQLIVNLFLFFIGCFGVLIHKQNTLLTLVFIEVLLLSVNLNFLILSSYLDDMYGLVFSIFILTVAAGESAIGLAIIILFYRLYSSIKITSRVGLFY